MLNMPIGSIKAGDILAKEVCMANGTVILPADTVIKEEYLHKLKELGISNVYIKEIKDIKYLINNTKLEKSTEEKIKEQCQEKVQTTIEKFSSYSDVELNDIIVVAEQILDDALNNSEVMYNVSFIRDRSESIYAHSVNVAAMSVLVGLQLKLSEKRVMDVAVGAILHDMGLAYLPEYLRGCILEECSKEEKELIIRHVLTGYSAVEKEDWLSKTAKEIIFSHHEMCDGSGYLRHLTKSHLCQEVKIVTVCDTFDSMVYGNFVRRLKVHETIDYITSQAGTRFDLRTVQAFVNSVAAYPLGTHVILNNGDIGVVIGQNRKIPDRPIVNIIKFGDGTVPQEIIQRDLTKELTLFIRDTIE